MNQGLFFEFWLRGNKHCQRRRKFLRSLFHDWMIRTEINFVIDDSSFLLEYCCNIEEKYSRKIKSQRNNLEMISASTKKKKNVSIYYFFPFLQWNNLRHTNYVRSNWNRNVIKILNERNDKNLKEVVDVNWIKNKS